MYECICVCVTMPSLSRMFSHFYVLVVIGKIWSAFLFLAAPVGLVQQRRRHGRHDAPARAFVCVHCSVVDEFFAANKVQSKSWRRREP